MIANRISNIRLIATAASDLKLLNDYDLRSHGTVLLLPEKVDEENDNKIVI